VVVYLPCKHEPLSSNLSNVKNKQTKIIKSEYGRDICPPMFIAESLIIGKKWKPKCPLIAE
jgi:hypothetical protein